MCVCLRFWQLLGVADSHSTLLLCGRSLESAVEIEVVCRSTGVRTIGY